MSDDEPSDDADDSNDSFLRAVAAVSVRKGQAAQLARSGTVLGGFTLGERIGSGGMGIVYSARDPSGQAVAVKVLRARDHEDDTRRRRFLREAKVAAAIEHPNIVRTIAVGEHGDETFIAMELLEGESLRARLHRGPAEPPEAVAIARDVARGLAAAHAVGVVHRDVKPENLWLERGGSAKVLDFGLARWVDASRGLQSVLTARGGLLGTVGYMSPEQGRGFEVVPASDLFSLGAVLFELLAHARPFQGTTPTDVFLATAIDPTPDLRALRPGLPERLVALVEALLAKRPEGRPASAAEVAAELEAVRVTVGSGG